jgi:ribosomal protein S18 acetylase RimI-like enzyme
VNLAQVLLDPGHSLERDAFRAAGFFDLAVLSYLRRPLRQIRVRRPEPRWPDGARVAAFNDALNDALINVLAESYEDTLDCPGLKGYRRTQDILDGHRASGLFDPALWTLLWLDGSVVGSLLLNPSVDGSSIELVYLGLIKAVRGRGLGAELLRYGLRLVEGRREQSMHLAVDEANTPAIALYRREGFRPELRRLALIRPLTSH